MSNSKEIYKLVIKNIEMLEEAPNLIAEIQEDIFKEINDKFENFFIEKDGWNDSIFTYFEDVKKPAPETKFAPDKWTKNAWYKFDILNEDDLNYYLTALVGGLSQQYYGIIFEPDNSRFGMNSNEWATFLDEQYKKKKLKTHGVNLEDSCLCIPIVIDAIKMADEYPHFSDCLEPVDKALEVLMKIHQEIDAIVDEASRKAVKTKKG